MPDERLRIVIEALDKATAELKGLQNELEGVGAAGKKAATGWDKADESLKNMAKGVGKATLLMAGFAIAAKAVFNIGKQGAEKIGRAHV